ncbi:hypothetical protein [Phenylobacterium montanum]|uniref:Uncharacterized protein n=1 Tax=Phenylobacterium montanum TaxID=2823693 RepID=A0A975FW69_9CAUL|nr:hypothetical protein [Caulobacter sp. S6]QUD86593.1 hypothetical protein KCG34_16070 [Caulobacter sp. S6]
MSGRDWRPFSPGSRARIGFDKSQPETDAIAEGDNRNSGAQDTASASQGASGGNGHANPIAEDPERPNRNDPPKASGGVALVVSIITAAIAAAGVWVSNGNLEATKRQADAASGQLSVMMEQLSDARSSAAAADSAAAIEMAKQDKQISANQTLAAAAANQAIAAKTSAEALKGQVALMQAQQRPWITLNISTKNPLQFFNLPDGPHAFMPLDIRLENIGQSPAFNVNSVTWGYLSYPGHADFTQEATSRCESFRKEVLDNPNRGEILFPHDHVDISLNDQRHFATQAIGFMPKEIASAADRENNITIFLYGCVDYMFGKPKTHHQSGVIFQLFKRVKLQNGQTALDYNFKIGENIPASDILFLKTPSDSWQTD